MFLNPTNAFNIYTGALGQKVLLMDSSLKGMNVGKLNGSFCDFLTVVKLHHKGQM